MRDFFSKLKLNIILFQPKIHVNTGAIGRSCVGFGAKLHLIGPLGFSLEEKKVKRAGLDYWPLVELQTYTSWNEFLPFLKNLGPSYFFQSSIFFYHFFRLLFYEIWQNKFIRFKI
jgi:tRNA (cytidine/uridine-2'-O-)-methyltransferase